MSVIRYMDEEYREITSPHKQIFPYDPPGSTHEGSGLPVSVDHRHRRFFRHEGIIFSKCSFDIMYNGKFQVEDSDNSNPKVFVMENDKVTFKPKGFWIHRDSYGDEPYFFFVYHGHRLCISDEWGITFMQFDETTGCFRSWVHKEHESVLYTFDAKLEVYGELLAHSSLPVELLYEIYKRI